MLRTQMFMVGILTTLEYSIPELVIQNRLRFQENMNFTEFYFSRNQLLVNGIKISNT